MSIYEVYKRYRAAYKNYIGVMWNLYRNKKIIEVILKDGTHEKFSPDIAFMISDLLVRKGADFTKVNEVIRKEKSTLEGFSVIDFDNLLDHGVMDFSEIKAAMKNIMEYRRNERILYKNNTIVMHGLKEVGDIFGVFMAEDYKWLNVENEIVVDIGAQNGDSAIYFALNGAKKVIAIEPQPYSFDFAIRNVKENGLEKVIELLNAGYGKDRVVSIDENYKGMDLRVSKEGKPLKLYTLENLVQKFNLGTAVLKMDCEGCEYNMLNEKNSTLARFSQMKIEYHRGYKRLVGKLRDAGFNVEWSTHHRVETVGFIYASKPRNLL